MQKCCTPSKPLAKKRAFTLIEAAAAAVITAAFFIPAVGITSSAARGFFSIQRNYRAAVYAKNILENKTLPPNENYKARLVIQTNGETQETNSGAPPGYSPPVTSGEPNFADPPPETQETGGIKIKEHKNRDQNVKITVDVYTNSSEFISRIIYVR